jgi:2-polyprenyl-6-methoxyphenol hydroxylase-like FAD-dependent oxidoreductase
MVPQNLTEKVLLDRLEELGGRVHRPSFATGLRQTADGAEVTLDGCDVVKGDYVIAAGGMDSTIRELAGLGDDGHTRYRSPSRSLTSGWKAVCRRIRLCCSSLHTASWSWLLFPTGRSAWWPTSTTRRNSRTLRSRRSS